MAAKKAAAKKPAAKKTAAKKAAAKKPAAAPANVRVLSAGKTRRHREANRCPGGVGVLDRETGACSTCPSAAECTVARFPQG